MLASLTEAVHGEDCPREVIAALLGALVTTVITQLSLGHQSRGEELRERNVEVFKRKLSAFNAFTALAMKYLKDGRLTIEEAHDLRSDIYKITPIGKPETVSAVTGYVRSHLSRDDETGLFTDITPVLEAFRSDLGLEDAATDGLLEMETIDRILGGDITDMAVRRARGKVRRVAKAILAAIARQDAELFAQIEPSATSPGIDGVQLDLARRPGTTFSGTAPYERGVTNLQGYLDYSDLPRRDQAWVTELALTCGSANDQDETGVLTFAVALDEPKDEVSVGERTMSAATLASAMVAIERGVDERDCRPTED